MDDLKYPVGKFSAKPDLTPSERAKLIESIAAAPGRMRAAVQGLSDEQLDTPYRDGGWTVRQVVHHVPISHMHAYVRMCFALTEDSPEIKVYEESVWANLADARTAPIQMSLQLLEALHERWLTLMRSLSDDDFTRTFVHPEYGAMTLSTQVQLYEWHGRHHVAHITNLRKRMQWS
jgi:uncharacterized damage-inducible protein DinB